MLTTAAVGLAPLLTQFFSRPSLIMKFSFAPLWGLKNPRISKNLPSLLARESQATILYEIWCFLPVLARRILTDIGSGYYTKYCHLSLLRAAPAASWAASCLFFPIPVPVNFSAI